MTGFGRAEAQVEGRLLAVEVRSVNGRHLDVRARVPRELAALEGVVRDRVGRHLRRGSVDVSVRLGPGTAGDARVEIDMAVARGYLEAARALAADAGWPAECPPAALLALPGVVRLREVELDMVKLAAAVDDAVDAACAGCVEMRAREGAALEVEITARAERTRAVISEIEARAAEVTAGLRARLARRLLALAPEVTVEPGRLEQELVLYVDRTDVTEETVRFRSHLDQLRETLAAEPPVGRKLEFVLQEMSRETNTIGSKAADAPLSRWVVELKTEIEKLREQVQNVE
jgi:uncharacterized protein (TIGR00255 family)